MSTTFKYIDIPENLSEELIAKLKYGILKCFNEIQLETRQLNKGAYVIINGPRAEELFKAIKSIANVQISYSLESEIDYILCGSPRTAFVLAKQLFQDKEKMEELRLFNTGEELPDRKIKIYLTKTNNHE